MSDDLPPLRAVFINCTLEKQPSDSHTQVLLDASGRIMEGNGVAVRACPPALTHRSAWDLSRHDRAWLGARRLADAVGEGQGGADPGDRHAALAR